MLLLHDRHGSYGPQGEFTWRLPALISYRAALEYAQQPNEPRFMHLQNMFGDLEFSFDEKKGVLFTLLSADKAEDKVIVPMPAPEQFIAGHLVYPPRLARLLQMRERLSERLIDYDLFLRTLFRGSARAC